jgi:hypothetical protein
MKRVANVACDMALDVLAYNLAADGHHRQKALTRAVQAG